MKEVFGPIIGFKILEGPEGAPKRLDTKIDAKGIEVLILNGFRWERTIYPFEQIESAVEDGNFILILNGTRYVLQAKKPEHLVAKIEDVKNRSQAKTAKKEQPELSRKIGLSIFGLLLFITVVTVISVIFETQIREASIRFNKQTEEKIAKLEREEEIRNSPENIAYTAVIKAFGEASQEEDPGIIGFEYSKEEILINYRLFPIGISPLSDEIGRSLSPKIKNFYEILPESDKIKIYITLPYEDKLGNRTWHQSFVLSFDRALYQEIKWDNFKPNNLIDVARDFQKI